MDIDDAINVVENQLRDLIELVLRNQHRDSWFDHLGVTADRVTAWKERRDAEPKQRPGAEVEERLLYYSEFFDIVAIIQHNWQDGFKDCFGDRKRFDVYTERLTVFRNPDAHSRALVPFEQHLVLGMTGELRQLITVFRSAGGGGPEPEHFARIEEIRDSYGTRVTGGPIGRAVSTLTLRPGDTVSFVGRAWDPESSPIEWKINLGARVEQFYENGADLDWEWNIDDRDIGEESLVMFSISSARHYKRSTHGDDVAIIVYKVLPPAR